MLGFQAFAGLRYRFNDTASLGVNYRFLMTEAQKREVQWRDGSRLNLGGDFIRLHAIGLVFEATF